MSQRNVGSATSKHDKVTSRRRGRIQRAVEVAGDRGLSRLAIHLVERATIARLKGESSKHWTERQLHKQYDEESRERVRNVMQEIHDANLWPWG